jgi:hypothetical protein
MVSSQNNKTFYVRFLLEFAFWFDDLYKGRKYEKKHKFEQLIFVLFIYIEYCIRLRKLMHDMQIKSLIYFADLIISLCQTILSVIIFKIDYKSGFHSLHCHCIFKNLKQNLIFKHLKDWSLDIRN